MRWYAVAYASGGDRCTQGIAGRTGRMAAMTMVTDAALDPVAIDTVALARLITAPPSTGQSRIEPVASAMIESRTAAVAASATMSTRVNRVSDCRRATTTATT